MKRSYSPEEKTRALERLRQTGNIILTSLETGISERTLRNWRQKAWIISQRKKLHDIAADLPKSANTLPQVLPPNPPPLRRQSEDELNALDLMRGKILDELLNSATDFHEILAYMPPYQRAHVIVMLLDRLMKLDEHLKPYRPQEEIHHRLADSEGEEPNGKPTTDNRPQSAEIASGSTGDSQI